MFDTFNVKTAAPYPQTIHEHRVPTDDSIRLATEYQDRAKDAILWSHDFTDNAINGRVVCFAGIDGYPTISIAFTLNGKRHTIHHKNDCYAPLARSRQEAARFLLDAVSTEFVRYFIPQLVEIAAQ